MTVLTRAWRAGALGVVALTAVACGNPNMKESRGYTKEPLEQPGLIVRGEEPGEMSRFGGPRRVRADRIELPEPAPAAAAAVAGPVELPPGFTQEMVAEGQQLYAGAGNCATCHGQGGAGSPLAPALNDGDWIHVDGSIDALAQIIASGVPQPAQYPAAMPARGGSSITDAQVRNIAAYIYTMSR